MVNTGVSWLRILVMVLLLPLNILVELLCFVARCMVWVCVFYEGAISMLGYWLDDIVRGKS
jgi:hypothetical protein